METLFRFLDGMAWVFGTVSLLVCLLKWLLASEYHRAGSQRRLLDTLNGVRRVFPMRRWLLVLVTCVVWLVTTWK